MMNYTAIQATLAPIEGQSFTIDILSAEHDGETPPEDWAGRASWLSIIEIKRGGQTLFVLHSDGQIEAHGGFKVDEAAAVFWQAVVALIPQLAWMPNAAGAMALVAIPTDAAQPTETLKS